MSRRAIRFVTVALVAAALLGAGRGAGPAPAAAAGPSFDQYVAAVAADLDAYWRGQVTSWGSTYTYRTPTWTTYEQAVDAGVCGTKAAAQEGSFYCFGNSTIYFLAETTTDTASRTDLVYLWNTYGPFAAATMMAHEWAHHVQNLLRGTQGGGINRELQADCLAGVWVSSVDGLTQEDYNDGQWALYGVGDDVLKIPSEQWGHGSAAQRLERFRTGYRSGRANSC